MPFTLRPVRASEVTSPAATGSAVAVMTIGIVSVWRISACVAGVVVTGLNPKNLLLVIAGAAAVASAGATAGEEAVAWAIFTLIAIVGVATPVVISFAMGDRSDELLRRLRAWMAHNNGVIMAVILLLIGVKLLGDGIAGL